jgi:acetaldehyde dehydrogenase (acetylating)
VILNLNPAIPCVDMQTTMFIKYNGDFDIVKFKNEVDKKVIELKSYVPYYELVIPPFINDLGINTAKTVWAYKQNYSQNIGQCYAWAVSDIEKNPDIKERVI